MYLGSLHDLIKAAGVQAAEVREASEKFAFRPSAAAGRRLQDALLGLYAYEATFAGFGLKGKAVTGTGRVYKGTFEYE